MSHVLSSDVLRRVVRRETHSPRTVATVITLIVVLAAAVMLGIEVVLGLLGQDPLVVAPSAALAWLTSLPTADPQAAVIAGGAIVALLGVWLFVLAVSPGRRSKHFLAAGQHAVVVDNAVIASAVADRVRRDFDLHKDDVRVGVSHRSADVMVRPAPGLSIDTEGVRAAAAAEIAGYGLRPALRVVVRQLPRTDNRRVA